MKSSREIGQEPITKFSFGNAAHKASRILQVSYTVHVFGILACLSSMVIVRSFFLYFDSSRRVALPYLW